LPTTTHVAAGTDRRGCAISLRRGVYWVTAAVSKAVNRHDLTAGNVTATIAAGLRVDAMGVTPDRRFLLLAGDSDTPIVTADTHENAVVDSGDRLATGVSVCNDGTIVSTMAGSGAKLATYSINSTGHLTALMPAASSATVANSVCSPSSRFVVTVIDVFQVSSFAIDTLNRIDSMTLTRWAMSLVFNPANADLYLLQYDGVLSQYAFNGITGMFGVLQARFEIDRAYSTYPGVQLMNFAYAKLFVHAGDQLLTYDTELTLLSSETIAIGSKTAICVSEGMLCSIIFAVSCT
jgi:hypothetical protein